MKLETMRELLKDRKIKQISDFTGLSGVTIYNIRDGVNLSPTLSTMKKIEAYFQSCDERVKKALEGRQ
jgi:predicted transcriptional regulator